MWANIDRDTVVRCASRQPSVPWSVPRLFDYDWHVRGTAQADRLAPG
jgi:hypothetical protein